MICGVCMSWSKLPWWKILREIFVSEPNLPLGGFDQDTYTPQIMIVHCTLYSLLHFLFFNK
jgi:hypothetical protein